MSHSHFSCEPSNHPYTSLTMSLRRRLVRNNRDSYQVANLALLITPSSGAKPIVVKLIRGSFDLGMLRYSKTGKGKSVLETDNDRAWFALATVQAVGQTV